MSWSLRIHVSFKREGAIHHGWKPNLRFKPTIPLDKRGKLSSPAIPYFGGGTFKKTMWQNTMQELGISQVEVLLQVLPQYSPPTPKRES